MKEVLRFKNVSMRYHSKQGETIALENANFSVNVNLAVANIESVWNVIEKYPTVSAVKNAFSPYNFPEKTFVKIG